MKSVHGLVLVAVLAVGVLLGIYVRGGIDRAAKASPAARGEELAGSERFGPSAATDLRPAAVSRAGDFCLDDSDCEGGETCLGEDIPDPPLPPREGRCYQVCQNASDCDDDGYSCTEEACSGPVQFPEGELLVCFYPYSDATCGHLRETHLVTTVLTTDGNARSVGIWGDCFDETLGPTVPSEECVFTVESVQYRRDPLTGATKFEVVCVDLDPNDSVPTCSLMERPPLAFSIGPSVGPHFGGAAGVAAGVHGAAWAGFEGALGFSVPINIHRRFRYPMFRLSTGRVGGNVLIESGVGSLVAKESVVFGHNGFEGEVTFFVTKPKGMHLTVGSKNLFGDPVCDKSPCPTGFSEALTSAAGLFGPATALASSGDAAGAGEFESDFDIEEVKEALDHETQAIEDIIVELRARIEQKIAQTFEMLQEFLGGEGSGASAVQRSALVDETMDLLRGRIRENLEEIREIARDLVACPDN